MQAVKNKMRYIIFIITAVFIAFTATFVLFAIISLVGRQNYSTLSMKQLSEELTPAGDRYVLSEQGQALLDTHQCFAFIIDSAGQRSWSYHVPDDIPQSFSRPDINSLSRWYLHDHPVTTWNLGDDIVVVGYPVKSFFRYDLMMPLQQMELLILFFIPCGVLIFAGIFILGTRWNHKQTKLQETARTEWIAGVSHDIRTPLTAIIGYAEQLESSGFDTAEQQYQVSAILGQSKRIRLLVEDFNLVNKLEYGVLNGPKEAVNINAAVRRVAADLVNAGILSDAYAIELLPSEDYHVRGDEQLLYRVFYNLVLNSIRHNPQGCDITVSLKRKHFHRVAVVIADNGGGYPQDVLTQNKQRLNPWNSHGLGLLIVSKIITAHRGRLKLANHDGAVAEIVLASQKHLT